MKQKIPEYAGVSRAIRLQGVCDATGASRTTIWRWVKEDPTFPKPFKLSEAVTVWDEDEVRGWLAGRKQRHEHGCA